MDVHTNIPLKNYTTMRLGGPARFMTEIRNIDDISSVCQKAIGQNLPIFILGGGSNVLARDEGYSGLILLCRIPGFEVIADDPSSTTIKIGGGENWDEVVRRTVEMGLTGIEALSAIPGTAGAAPVQNIGAYGQEISETLVSLEAYDITANQYITLQNEDCNFSYRNSIFRDTAKGRYFITSITIRLYKSSPQPPFYDALQNYLDNAGITFFTPDVIRKAVIDIRKEKLPDPAERPNVGSFFKNAIVEDWQLNGLKEEYPDIPTYELPNGSYKIPTGWLIEQTGLKGQLLHGIRIHDKNALVLINESATGYADLDAARSEIMGAVRDTFRISIEQEPIEIR
jgi:UDP-N-acetylmuramate dehydrogenase